MGFFYWIGQVWGAFWTWSKSFPTALVALVSSIIALLAYIYQRKEARKRAACHLAQQYADDILPRIRYINKVLALTGVKKYCDKFSGFVDFTTKELDEFLRKADCSAEDFLNPFKTITTQMLDAAFVNSGCASHVKQFHDSLSGISDGESKKVAFHKQIIDLLNDLEAFSLQFHYNLAEEKLVYQSLHQTFLDNMRNWYFFISFENRFDQDRSFLNVIWLYQVWEKRKNADEKSISKVLSKRLTAKKL